MPDTVNPDTSNTNNLVTHKKCNNSSVGAGYNDFDYQMLPVPDQLRNEVFIKLHSERWRLNPPQDVIDALNKTRKFHKNPTTADAEKNRLKSPMDNILWSDPVNQFTADFIDEYRRKSDGFGNYGIINRTLTVMDADDTDVLESKYGVMSRLPETFTVKSGRITSHGAHIYLNVLNIPVEKTKAKVEFGSLGDIRFPGISDLYTVGAYSMHPSGNRYLPVNTTTPVATIEYDDLEEILADIPTGKGKRVTSFKKSISKGRKVSHEEYMKSIEGNYLVQLRREWAKNNDPRDWIPEDYAFNPANDRWLSPQSESGIEGIYVYRDGEDEGIEKLICHHDNDKIFECELAYSSFDMLVLEHDGNVKEADKEVLDWAKKEKPELYRLYKESCRSWASNQGNKLYQKFMNSVPADPVTKVRQL